MRIYVVALLAALGFIALACVEGSGPVDLTPAGKTPTAGVPVGAETGPLTHGCQGPEFALFERPTFQDTNSRSGRPLQPLVFCGRVIVEGEAAPDGTLVEAMVEGERCATTRSRGGLYWLRLPLFRCPEKLTAELTFLVEGQPARRLRRLGSVQYVDLIVGQASRSPDLMPVAEAEVAGARVGVQAGTATPAPAAAATGARALIHLTCASTSGGALTSSSSRSFPPGDGDGALRRRLEGELTVGSSTECPGTVSGREAALGHHVA